MTDSSALPLAHPAFRPIRRERIDSLNMEVQQFEHAKTGAMHYHLASDNDENVFLVALRTVPQDSTGVAHILEHTALCGSERYPVRDPFFMMLRRSLNTFMNAFTSSDWTAYPFASQNRKDFNNLLEVYLDAVFFSRLDPLDFAQEGHRVEFAEPANPDSELVYKGVVFNEMKGAMSSVSSVLWDTLCRHLFPTSTYHYNSGGDPEYIPDLSYEQLQAFYRSHYHPSNAIFMTFGNIPATEHQTVFEERALGRFDRLDQHIEVRPEQHLPAPLRVSEPYALDDGSDTEHRTHLVMGWMLGESTDLRQLLEAQLLSSVLLENSASPLQHLLETTELGQSPSPLCGLEDSMREMVFCCGLEGSDPEHAERFEEEVLAVIRRVAEQGVPAERLEAILHQLELHQREISGDSYPYGLQLILRALGCATHYSDPIAVLDLDPVIALLREEIADPDFIRGLARRLLLENSHRVTLVMEPDPGLSARRLAAEKERLARLRESMDRQQREAVVSLAQRLLERQAREDDESILPRVELTDVPPGLPQLEYREHGAGGLVVTTYGQGTNGLVYQQVVRPLPALSDAQLDALPYYTSVVTELGIGEDSYLHTQDRQSAAVGSISAYASMRGAVDDEQTVHANLVLSSKALWRNVEAQSELMHDTLYRVRFDEAGRIRDLVSQLRARREQAVTGHGHGLAMTAACAGFSPLAALNHRLSGLEGIRAVRALDRRLRDAPEREAFAAELAALHSAVSQTPMRLLAVAESEHTDALASALLARWGGDAEPQGALFSPPPVRETRRELWVTNTQVNFCARAYPTVPVNHPDAAALTVLGGLLRNGHLHRSIREQGGAYGGGASQDSSIAAFRFYSYRDPRLEETLRDFDDSLRWLLHGTLQQRALEEAILGVIGSLDRPSSPAGEAKQDFHNRLFGRDHAQRELFRRRILEVTLDDLCRVGETYLRPERSSTAVVTSPAILQSDPELAERLGLTVREL